MFSAIRPHEHCGDYPLRRMINQNFGNGLWDENLEFPIHPAYPWGIPHHLLQRPRQFHSPQESGFSDVHLSKDKFEVKLDCHHFLPEEVKVTTVEGYVVVEGEHEEKGDPHGFITRTFKRRYHLPDNVKPENIVCNLSSDGVLIITVPRVEAITDSKVKVLPITQTGKPALPTHIHNTSPNPSPTLINNKKQAVNGILK